MPGRPGGDVGQCPGRFELQGGLVVHGQELHEAREQTGVHDLLQRRVLLPGEQFPEETGENASRLGDQTLYMNLLI